MRKVVCLGGGNAMPKAVLAQIKNEKIDLSVISATLDSGGSSGKLRRDFNIIAVGDMRRAFLELSPLRRSLDYRFKNGHNLLNLIMAVILIKEKDPVNALNDFFKPKFRVLPATLDNVNLCALLFNGEIVKGETNIDIPKHNSRIKKVFLDKKAFAFKETREKLSRADFIIIGPGDLYSSLIQILLVTGIKEAIKKSKAKIIYICNLENKKGETDDFTVSDFEKEIEKYLGKDLDYIIFNNNKKVDFVQFNAYNDSKHIGIDLYNSSELIKKLRELII